MAEKDGSIVLEITLSVLEENNKLFCVDVMDFMSNPDMVYFKGIIARAMNKYGLMFFESFMNNDKVSYGLLLGLTKRYLEFSLKKILPAYKNKDEKTIDKLFEKMMNAAISTAQKSVENNVIVYVIYREMKSAIDKLFECDLESLCD